MLKKLDHIFFSEDGNKYLLPFSLLVLFILSIPFFQADPDAYISTSRDAFTDEGLNTSQIRNWVLTRDLNTSECDNFIKTPLFQMYMGLGFSIFGISLLKARLWAFFANIIFIILAYNRSTQYKKVFLFASIISTFNYIGFQYLHFSMAESMASTATIWALAEFFRASYIPKQNIKKWIVPALAIWIVIALKNQFMYVIGAYFLWVLWHAIKEQKLDSTFKIYQPFIPLIIGGIAYILLVYLPMKESYDLIMQHQTSGRWVPSNDVWNEVKENFKIALFSNYPRFYIFWVIFGSIIGLIYLPKNFKNPLLLLLLLFLSWLAIELHKFGIRFTPTRYIVPTIWACSGTLAVLIFLFRRSLTNDKYGIVFVIWIIAMFIMPYKSLLENRTWNIKSGNEITRDLANQSNVDYIIGPWAPALSWETNKKSVPVWKNFLNGTDFQNKYPNAIIVTEFDQEDNESAFTEAGILIPNYSLLLDSINIRNKKIYIQTPISSSLEQ